MNYILLILLFLSPIKAQSNSFDLGEITPKKYSVTLPFELVDNMMIVTLPIKGKYYRFMFDTGAPNALSEEAIKNLNLESENESANLHDISGEKRNTSLYKGPNIDIQNVLFKNFMFIKMETLSYFPLSCFHLDGILGYNLLSKSSVSLDFQNKKIVISDTNRQNFISDGYISSGFSFFNNNAPGVVISHQFGNLVLGIDTGKNDGITLRHPKLASVLNKLGYDPDSTYQSDTLGAYGTKTYNINSYTLSDMRIGRLIIDNTQVSVEDQDGISLVGVSFLSNFRITIDFPSRVIWFKSITKGKYHESSPRYGFNLNLIENGEILVSNLIEGTQAEKSGLRNGDKIIGINGHNKKTYTQEDYCNIYLNKSSNIYIDRNSNVTLDINRKGKLDNVKIRYKKQKKN